MKHLRQYIRQVLQEVYELTDKDKQFAGSMGIDPYADSDTARARALGLQSKEQIIKDREALTAYQEKLKSTPEGRKLIQQFLDGTDVTIMHAINYQGYATSIDLKSKNRGTGETPFQSWLSRRGRRGKDVLSVVASSRPLGSSFRAGIFNRQAASGLGFIMKGYPVFISETDVMSQTLGSLPTGLVKHQQHSGVAKRPGEGKTGITRTDFGWAGEVLLDNWSVIGTYMDISTNNNLAIFVSLARDSMNVAPSLPMYIYDNGTFVGIIKDEKSLEEVRKKLFGF